MYTYNLFQWILLFFIYCFLGWCVESTIVSTREKRFINRGFLKGPFLPIYGTGTILIKIKYWDYTDDKFNYKGRICLVSSLFWGVLTLFVVYIIHAPISNLISNLGNTTIIVLSIIASIIFIFDFVYSTYNVLDLNRILKFMTKIREEMETLSNQIKEKTSSLSSTDLSLIKEKLSSLKVEYDKYAEKVNFFHKQIIKAYPSASSKKFNEAFKVLKDKIGNTFRRK
ncbi:putative ABC transporter permease [Clostridium sp.]|uniref:putative ABC transporter permease n=1 Tax=Clostridium sp. TaxID=1506 RepID=UPI0029043D65|nr:putative ABC transporter permease [Clostridium sp.]MDU1309167.1 putative ABC transporter permease [Clostridium sp.]